ncbi:MAG: hypothetical protein ACPL1Y_04245 [Thermoplasmata archaeon]
MAKQMKYLDGYESYISVTQDPINDCLAFAQLAGDRIKLWFSAFPKEEICPRVQNIDINVIYFVENTEYTTEKLWQYLHQQIIQNERVCILFDDPSPLLITHTFEKLSMNLKALADLVSEHDSLMLVCIDKHKFHRRQIAFLKTFLQVIKLHQTAFFPPDSKCVCPICGAIIDCYAQKCEGCGVVIIEDADSLVKDGQKNEEEAEPLTIIRSQLKLYNEGS